MMLSPKRNKKIIYDQPVMIPIYIGDFEDGRAYLIGDNMETLRDVRNFITDDWDGEDVLFKPFEFRFEVDGVKLSITQEKGIRVIDLLHRTVKIVLHDMCE